MKTLLLTSFFLLAFTILRSQEIISTSGAYFINSDISVSYTIGEPIIETLQSVDYQLTQGFHQTKLIISSISSNHKLDYTLKVYPNPTNEYIYIEIITKDELVECLLTDINGKILSSYIIEESITSFDMRSYTPGVYFICLKNSTNQITTHKIVKQ